MIEYKIRQKSTGLFYVGGKFGLWTKRGKLYIDKRVATKIVQSMKGGRNQGVEIVPFEIKEITNE